jgi:hypothetical protein
MRGGLAGGNFLFGAALLPQNSLTNLSAHVECCKPYTICVKQQMKVQVLRKGSDIRNTGFRISAIFLKLLKANVRLRKQGGFGKKLTFGERGSGQDERRV